MKKFKKMTQLCMTILMCFAMTTLASCSFFGQDSSDTGSNSQTQDSPSESPAPDDNPSSEDTTNGGNWTGEAPID